jgi:Lon protease-like protein
VASHSLPLFPLPLVLFPGAPLPLHIFEPRYRELLADCRAGDGRFGIILTTGGPERALPAGRVGCVAELRDVRMLPDGRANVLVEGSERFALERFTDAPHAYHVARVASYDDEPGEDPIALAEAAVRARGTFTRVANAARVIADEREPLPELPSAPELLAFRIASLIDFERDAQQALLESRSPLGRLIAVEALLARAVESIEERAATHGRARTNGHGPNGPE